MNEFEMFNTEDLHAAKDLNQVSTAPYCFWFDTTQLLGLFAMYSPRSLLVFMHLEEQFKPQCLPSKVLTLVEKSRKKQSITFQRNRLFVIVAPPLC